MPYLHPLPKPASNSPFVPPHRGVTSAPKSRLFLPPLYTHTLTLSLTHILFAYSYRFTKMRLISFLTSSFICYYFAKFILKCNSSKSIPPRLLAPQISQLLSTRAFDTTTKLLQILGLRQAHAVPRGSLTTESTLCEWKPLRTHYS